MRKHDLLPIFMLLVFVCTLFTGCSSDSKEIDDQVYTLVIGADKGSENRVRLTVQYPTYKNGGGGGMEKSSGGGGGKDESGEVDGTIVETVEAPSILEAVNLLNTSVPRSISFIHAKMFVFSEDFARDGIGSYLEPLARFRETRRIMQVVVCRGKAEDFIKENKVLIGSSIAKTMELMSTQALETGCFPFTSFHNFYTSVLSPYGQAYAAYAGLNDFKNMKNEEEGKEAAALKTENGFLPGEIPRQGGTKGEFVGTAVFNGDRMVGSLDSYETRYFMMVIGRYQRGIITISDENEPGSAIPLDVRLGRKSEIKGHFEDGKPVIDVHLSIESDLGAVQSRIQYEKLNKIGDLNNYIARIIKRGVENTIEKTKKELESDIFDFGRYFAGYFTTIQEFEEYDWLSHYREAQVNVSVEADVRRTGTIVDTSPIRHGK